METTTTTTTLPISKDALLAACIAFRDSLPADHNRRQRLKNVNDLRFDTTDPTICYLMEPTSQNLRRIDPTQPVEKLAEAMILYPSHTMLTLQMSPADATRMASLERGPIQSMSSVGGIQATLFVGNPLAGVRDIFLTDTPGTVVVHLEENVDAEAMIDKLMDEVLRQSNEAKYFATTLVRTIAQSMATAAKDGTGLNFGISLDQGFVWQLRLMSSENGERLAKVKQEVATLVKGLTAADPENNYHIASWIWGTLHVMFPQIWPRPEDSAVRVVESNIHPADPTDSSGSSDANMDEPDTPTQLTPPTEPTTMNQINPPANQRPVFTVASLTDLVD